MIVTDRHLVQTKRYTRTRKVINIHVRVIVDLVVTVPYVLMWDVHYLLNIFLMMELIVLNVLEIRIDHELWKGFLYYRVLLIKRAHVMIMRV